ncbi:MAG: 30S ribosome-binding factor RbfA [Spartobacteria bacterium]|nr:30S ribosome-binding factor RbfA [Spartobacteria bacterium]
MGTRRLTRVNELLKRELADDLFRVANDGSLDLAAITITRVNVTPNLRHAQVYVSILGHEQERQQMLHKLQQHRKELQHELNAHTQLKYTPQLTFELDESIEQGDHILSIIAELEQTTVYDENTEEPLPETEHERPEEPGSL